MRILVDAQVVVRAVAMPDALSPALVTEFEFTVPVPKREAADVPG